jgi:hypothetical protein
VIQDILLLFQGASGLGCNFEKCQMAPIRCDDEQINLAASLFFGQVVRFLVKYLGVPFSVAKLPKSAFQPLIDRLADRLPTWKGRLLQRTGRLTLIKTTLSAMHVYVSICLGLPAWVYKTFQKIMTGFLWTRTEEVQNGKCLVTWSDVQRPVQLGELGVLDLRQLGMALRLRLLWLQRTDQGRPWVAMLVPIDAQSKAFFNASIQCRVSDGSSTLFWVDLWIQGKLIADLAPELFQVAHARRRSRCSVASALTNNAWIRDIVGPMTVPVLIQYL